MKKVLILLLALFVFSVSSSVIVLADGGCDGGGSGGGSGFMKEIDSAGVIESHAFHTVRGITVLNLVQGQGNISLANTNVFFVDNAGEVSLPLLDEDRENSPDTFYDDKDFGSRISTHAFHDVKGVTMVQLVSGNSNTVTTDLNVIMTAGFMENAFELFHTDEHEHE